ncbi:MAG: putative amidohydrolase [Oceanicoccus sp.]|jgi:predicted amidohydrolase
MFKSTKVRVASCQYRVDNDVGANLQVLLQMIDKAAAGGAQLLVAPEFGNHTSFYNDKDHAWQMAVSFDGDYVQAVKDRAKQHSMHVVFNSTRRGDRQPTAYVTNFLIGPDGELIGSDDKQVLMSGEAESLASSTHVGRVFDTAIGRIGMMSCLDGVPPETARNLALNGAQIITNSHNSCALDEPYFHIPIRAAENNVWVIAAGKVGYICVDEVVEPLAKMVGAPKHIIASLGENVILDTNGDAVAQFDTHVQGLIFADIDVTDSDDKSWADGDLFADRRPDLYRAVAETVLNVDEQPKPAVECAIVQIHHQRPVRDNMDRALDMIADAAQNDAQLIVLPVLCIFDKAWVANNMTAAFALSAQFEQELSQLCKSLSIYVVASIVTEDAGARHTAILLDDKGSRIGHYHQSHLQHSDRSWCVAGNELPVFDTAIGRIGLMLGYDAVFPEVATVLARKGAEIIAHPTSWNFDWELRLALPERAAENRVSILSANRTDSVIERGGMISALSKSKPLRARDLNPIWPIEAQRDRECHISKTVYPERSRNKDLLGFDLQQGRRPELYAALVSVS